MPLIHNPNPVLINDIRYNKSKVLELSVQQCHALGKDFLNTVFKVHLHAALRGA